MRKLILSILLVCPYFINNAQNTLGDQVFHFYTFSHYPIDPLTLTQLVWPNYYIVHTAASNDGSFDVERSVRFVGKFRENCWYDFGDYNNMDWNKLMAIKILPTIDQMSIRLGWRPSSDNTKMELGFYGHIDHNDGSVCDPEELGREFFYLTDVNLGETFDVELYFSSIGLYVVAEGEGGAIRRDFGFADDYDLSIGTSVSRGAYFGGIPYKPPHKMQVEVSDIIVDNTLHYWPIALTKTYGRSIFYDGEQIMDCAQDKIVLSIEVEAGQYYGDCGTEGDPALWSELEDNGRYVIIENGADVVMSGNNGVRMLPGFHAEKGSHFIATTDAPVGCWSSGAFDKNMKLKDEYVPPFLYHVDKTAEEENIYDDPEEEVINEFKEFLDNDGNIFIFPNPSNGIVNVLLSGALSDNYSVEVFSVLGKTGLMYYVGQSGNLTIDLSGLKKGVYFIVINYDDNVHTERVILQ